MCECIWAVTFFAELVDFSNMSFILSHRATNHKTSLFVRFINTSNIMASFDGDGASRMQARRQKKQALVLWSMGALFFSIDGGASNGEEGRGGGICNTGGDNNEDGSMHDHPSNGGGRRGYISETMFDPNK